MVRIDKSTSGDDFFASEDVRTLEVHYNAHGERCRNFKQNVSEIIEYFFEDFPLESRTTLEYIRAVTSVSESCYSQHLAWVQQAKIPDGHRAIHEDEILARVLDMAISYNYL